MNFRCRECGEVIKIQTADKNNDIKVFHPECYTKFLVNYKEYGIRIGMRVHK